MSSSPSRRAENLAFVYQELLTAGERLRANRQPVQDAASFRQQLRTALASADQEARRRGYPAEDIQLASFAAVAFLDESILNLRSPIFADWPRRPLQEELFGHHVAGEIFFQNLQKILGRNDSHDAADLLEVYQLCLLLGFAGRYSLTGRGDLKAIADSAGDKIRRIRQLPRELSPGWKIPPEPPRATGADPWLRPLMFAAIGCLVLAILLFAGYKMSLGSSVGKLESLSGQARS